MSTRIAGKPAHVFFCFAGAVLAVLGSCLVAQNAQAQYSIDWYTIDGGGGTSTGGVYSVSGTIGQPDAGTMSGGNFTLQGGFWSIVSAVQVAGSPYLTVFRTATNSVLVTWPYPSTGFTLQQSPTLDAGSWGASTSTPVQSGTNWQIIVSPPNGNRFYRLIH